MNWEGVKRGIGMYLWFEAGFQLVTGVQNKAPEHVITASLCILISIIWLYPIFKNNGGS